MLEGTFLMMDVLVLEVEMAISSYPEALLIFLITPATLKGFSR